MATLPPVSASPASAAAFSARAPDAGKAGNVNVKSVSAASFQSDVLASSQPVLVEFGAAWCGPCRDLAGPLAAFASKYAGQLKVVTVDFDRNRELAATYEVTRLPTVLMFKGGKVIGRDKSTGADLEGLARQALQAEQKRW